MTEQEGVVLDELLKIERAESKRREKLIMLDQMKAEKLQEQKAAPEQEDANLAVMDEDARWELALRQKQEADKQADREL